MNAATAMAVTWAIAGLAHADSWFHPDWKHRQQVRIQEGFFVTTEDLKEFPVLIQVAAPDNRALQDAHPTGKDIVFTADDGVTPAPHEMEESPADGRRRYVCWVRAPILHVDRDTRLYMYYGNPGFTGDSRASEVWRNGYAAVWHMNGAERDGTLAFADSTGNGNHARGQGKAMPAAAGQVAGAVEFGPSGLLKVPHAPSLDFSNQTSFTVEAWVRLANAPRATFGLITKGGFFGWNLYHHDTGRWQAAVSDDARSRGNKIFAYHPTSGRTDWAHVAAVYEAPQRLLRLYVDGVQRTHASAEAMSNYQSKSDLVIGPGFSSPEARLLMDEVRVSVVARSADWLAASQKNQGFPDHRIRFGKPETRP